jgi:hypothetical protein
VKVTSVEVRDVELPESMQRAMARQAEAEREKRAKIIHAEGEYGAAEQLAAAAKIITSEESGLQLRYLQTLTEIAAERNSTIIFPLPIDMLSGLMGRPRAAATAPSASRTAARPFAPTAARPAPGDPFGLTSAPTSVARRRPDPSPFGRGGACRGRRRSGDGTAASASLGAAATSTLSTRRPSMSTTSNRSPFHSK